MMESPAGCSQGEIGTMIMDNAKHIKVSVLVPICNVEKYLERCLLSLATQSLEGLEVILLDDGSQDKSVQICDWYTAQIPFFRTIHKSNTGYGATMNLGIREAKGKYIGILESDDFAEPDMYENLYQAAIDKQAEVVFSNYFIFTHGENRFVDNVAKLPRTTFNIRNCDSLIRKNPAHWAGIYKKSFLQSKKIDFQETPGASFQDTGFHLKVLLMAKKITTIPQAVIHYRMDRPDSSVKSHSKIFCVADEYRCLWKYIDKHPSLNKHIRCLVAYQQFWSYLWNLDRLDGEAKCEFSKRLIQDFQKLERQGYVKKEYFVERGTWEHLQKLLHG